MDIIKLIEVLTDSSVACFAYGLNNNTNLCHIDFDRLYFCNAFSSLLIKICSLYENTDINNTDKSIVSIDFLYDYLIRRYYISKSNVFKSLGYDYD